MKKKLLLMFVFVCASFLYGVVNAQTYEGFIGAEDWKTVGTPQGSEEGYAPDFSYQISVVDEGKLQVTVDLSATCVGLVPQLFVNGVYLMNLNPVAGSSSQFSGTTPDAYEIGETLSVSFYFAYAGGFSDTNSFDYVVGSTNGALDDSEAPVLNSVTAGNVTGYSADITVNATDNQSASLTVEVASDEAFESVLATSRVASGEDGVCTLDNLSPLTDYTLYVRVSDLAGNVSEVKTVTFSTLEPADAVTFVGGIAADGWASTGTPEGEAEVFAPAVSYEIVTTRENRLQFRLSLDRVCVGMGVEVWIDGEPFFGLQQPAAENAVNIFEGENSRSYPRGTKLNIRFRFPFTGGVSETKPFEFEVGSKSGGSSVDDFVADAVRVYGANGELRVCGASGSQCCVYDLSGRLVMSCLVDGQEAVYSLNKGLYVVVVGGSVSKVVL